jgi:CRISPR/Cas system-associated exonuclease Cas4 (RecB family)
MTLIFHLYQVYLKEKKTTETFDEFYYWGEMLLNDFDDIDKYLVDPKQLFQNLSDLKEIEKQFSLPEEQIKVIREFWVNIKLHEASPLKDDFISVWSVLHEVYVRFQELLHSKNLAYEGMMCRQVVNRIRLGNSLDTPFRRYAFIGFNALNECEKEFFLHLQKDKIADFFWDYDDYYIENDWHEAGFFIRQNLRLFPQPWPLTEQKSLTSRKNIQIVAVPSDIGQAKLLSTILQNMKVDQGTMADTAVVLADEPLLIPVLSSLPAEITEVNVTLGYPFRYTPVYSFFEALLTMQKNVKLFKDGSYRFYHRDVTSLLNHPYVQKICGEEAVELSTYILQYNRVFLTREEVSTHEYLTKLFSISTSSSELLNFLTEIGSKTARLISDNPDDPTDGNFNREYWFTFITAANRLSDLLAAEHIPLEIPTLVRVLRKMTSALSIPFKGEPLAGLQVLGVLETRTLDFSNIVLLSANEGVLPKSDASNTFIPYNLRKGFGLPTIEHQDAVYAYYFYRLIQRAENVTILYNSQGGNKAREMSRFIYQLKYEPAFEIHEQSMNFRISLSDEKEIVVHKSDEVIDVLRQFTFGSGNSRILTPTALNAYLECSLRFYFRYVAKIYEKEEVTEDIEGSMFGKLLHKAMEEIYKPFLTSVMTKETFDGLIARKEIVESVILKAFATEFFKRPDEIPQLHGKSLVVKEVLRKYIFRILEIDQNLAPLTPLEFEGSFETTVTVDAADERHSVRIGGKIDRIDRTDQGIRVIDYKTGPADRKFQDVVSLFEVEGKNQSKEALQILMYAFILSENNGFQGEPIVPGIYGMREIFGSNFDSRLSMGKKEYIDTIYQVKDEYMDGLKRLLEDIYNPGLPFTKAEDKKVCEYCDYKAICHR